MSLASGNILELDPQGAAEEIFAEGDEVKKAQRRCSFQRTWIVAARADLRHEEELRELRLNKDYKTLKEARTGQGQVKVDDGVMEASTLAHET